MGRRHALPPTHPVTYNGWGEEWNVIAAGLHVLDRLVDNPPRNSVADLRAGDMRCLSEGIHPFITLARSRCTEHLHHRFAPLPHTYDKCSINMYFRSVIEQSTLNNESTRGYDRLSANSE